MRPDGKVDPAGARRAQPDSEEHAARSDICVRFERMVVRERSIKRRQPTLRRRSPDQPSNRCGGDIRRAVVLVLHMERSRIRSMRRRSAPPACTGTSPCGISDAFCGSGIRRAYSTQRAYVGEAKGGRQARAAADRADNLKASGALEQRGFRRASMIALMSARSTGSA